MSQSAPMKKKLTITIDADILPLAHRYAKSKGVSLSSLVEQVLRDMTREEEPTFPEKWRGRIRAAANDAPEQAPSDTAEEREPTFSEKWRGKFKYMTDGEIESARYEFLARKYHL